MQPQPRCCDLPPTSVNGIGMSNPFDFFEAIYCINLDDRVQAWHTIQWAFRHVGIVHRVRRFSAIDTRPLDNHHIGCALSHRTVLQDAKARGFRTILVFEEDALLHKHIHTHLGNSLRELATRSWDLFYLGGYRWGQECAKAPGCQFLTIPQGLTCTQSIAYHERIFDYILDHIPDNPREVEEWCTVHAAIDQWLMHKLQGAGSRHDGFRRGQCFLSSPIVATQPFYVEQEESPAQFMRCEDI